MNIASQKKQENIIEYILYLWKMQQLARGLNFDIEALQTFLVGSIKDSKELDEEINWNKDFFKQMKLEGLTEEGHLSEVQEILIELTYLHSTLLEIVKDKDYITNYDTVKQLIKEFNEKTPKGTSSDVESMIKALSAFLSLRISGKNISEETKVAIQKFSKVLGILASRYSLMKKGELNVNLN